MYFFFAIMSQPYVTINSRHLSSKVHEGCVFNLYNCCRCDSQSLGQIKISMQHRVANHQNSVSYQHMEVIPLYFLSKPVSCKINSFQSQQPNIRYGFFWHTYFNTTRSYSWYRKKDCVLPSNTHWICTSLSCTRTCLCVCTC